MVAHTFNPHNLERDRQTSVFEASVVYMVRPCHKTKPKQYKKQTKPKIEEESL